MTRRGFAQKASLGFLGSVLGTKSGAETLRAAVDNSGPLKISSNRCGHLSQGYPHWRWFRRLRWRRVPLGAAPHRQGIGRHGGNLPILRKAKPERSEIIPSALSAKIRVTSRASGAIFTTIWPCETQAAPTCVF